MKISLASSLHLDHGALSLDAAAGRAPPMQAFVPLGLLSLKAHAERALSGGVEIGVRELNTLMNAGFVPNDAGFYDHLARLILGAGDDLVGLMTDADSLHHTVMIAGRIKRLSPDTLVCVGGPASSPIGARFLERFSAFDLLVRGEGEETFAELLSVLRDARSPDAVAGLTWRDGATVRSNGDRPVIENLDNLAIPDFDAYPETGTAPLYLDVGRGCPFKCRFCATAPFWERRFRMKSIGRIITEMRLLRDRWGRTHVNFSHDIFTADRAWTHRFCDALTERPLGVTWSCSTRTDTIDPALLEHMAEAGCDEIYYGIETGSQEFQRRIDKGLDLARSREIVAATAAAGIRPVTGFIAGYPFETEESFGQTLRTFFDFLAVGGYRGHLFTLCPFPEAPMFAEHAAGIERAAEYHDLLLAPPAAAETASLVKANRDMFVSLYRYATPDLDPALVAGTEEISAHLVVLRRLWPLLLAHYPSPLDWYRRWIVWIERHNRTARPGTALPHQGDARDLMGFMASEIGRLKLEGTLLANLVRYETIKHVAAATLPAGTVAHNGTPLVSSVPVIRACSYLSAPFRHDLRPLLTGFPPAKEGAPPPAPFWIVFAKTGDGMLHTLHAPPLTRRLMELADQARPLGDLIDDALLRHVPPGDPDYVACHRIVEQLIDCNLFSEVTP